MKNQSHCNCNRKVGRFRVAREHGENEGKRDAGADQQNCQLAVHQRESRGGCDLQERPGSEAGHSARAVSLES